MKRYLILLTFLTLTAINGPAQQAGTAPAISGARTPAAVQESRISDLEWSILADALRLEDWDRASFFSGRLLKNVKADNDKKQLAQLRYLHLYSLAGKVAGFRSAGKAVEAEKALSELRLASAALIGADFVLTPRQFLNECVNVVNYVCRARDRENTLRITTTDRDGTAILSFDYVTFESGLPVIPEKRVFLGGRLQKAEYNTDPSGPWVMRLSFDSGSVTLAETTENK